MAFIPTVSVSRPEQLQEGAWYLIKGTMLGNPLPPQAFKLVRRLQGGSVWEQETVQGWIFWHMLGIRRQEWASMTLYDVNIPEHGNHDIHLERIPDQFMAALHKDESWKEIVQEVKKNFLRRNGKPRSTR